MGKSHCQNQKRLPVRKYLSLGYRKGFALRWHCFFILASCGQKCAMKYGGTYCEGLIVSVFRSSSMHSNSVNYGSFPAKMLHNFIICVFESTTFDSHKLGRTCICVNFDQASLDCERSEVVSASNRTLVNASVARRHVSSFCNWMFHLRGVRCAINWDRVVHAVFFDYMKMCASLYVAKRGKGCIALAHLTQLLKCCQRCRRLYRMKIAYRWWQSCLGKRSMFCKRVAENFTSVVSVFFGNRYSFCYTRLEFEFHVTSASLA